MNSAVRGKMHSTAYSLLAVRYADLNKSQAIERNFFGLSFRRWTGRALGSIRAVPMVLQSPLVRLAVRARKLN